jgi:hypothetical protein
MKKPHSNTSATLATNELTDKYQAGKWYPGLRVKNERAAKSFMEIKDYLRAHEKNQRENRINKALKT